MPNAGIDLNLPLVQEVLGDPLQEDNNIQGDWD